MSLKEASFVDCERLIGGIFTFSAGNLDLIYSFFNHSFNLFVVFAFI
jgi:hypothetical protein